MNRVKVAVLTSFFALSASVASAQAPPTSVPPIVQKFVTSVRRARTLSVEMTQATRFLPLRKAPGVTRAKFSLEKPNKFAVTWTAGETTILAAASDGVTLSEWDTRNYERQPAPESLEAMLTPLRRGLLLRPEAAAAEIAFVLFTHPEALAALPNLQDRGAEQINTVQTRKVTALTPEGSADFWFASDTGLPVQAVISDAGNAYTVRFLQYQIDKLVPNTVFAAAPPGSLTRMVTVRTALPNSLKTGTPAPDFTLQTLEGKPVTLSGLKGRVVLLAFCPPYLPGNFTDTALLLIRKARADLAAKELSVLWIAETDHPEREAAFAQAHSTDALTVLLDPPGPAAVEHCLYHIQGTPTFCVISRDGSIEAAFVGSLPEKQAVIQADARAAAVSVLLHGGVQHTDLSEYDQAEDMMDEASLKAALTTAGLGQARKN